jgi:cyanophycin synthetase
MKNKYLIYKNGKKIPYTKTLNNPESIKLTSNKGFTKKILNKHNLPTPKGLIYNKELENIKNFIKKVNSNLEYPLIIKPTNMANAIDVNINIKNENELKNLIIILEQKYKNLLIEEMIKGHLHRILLVNNNIIDIILRENPFVIGNGINSIKELINIENNNRKIDSIKNNKYLVLINKINKNIIKNQGYDINYILEKNIKVYISLIPTLNSGAMIKRINLSDVHPDNIKLFKKVSKIFNTTINGIDFISEDISKSYKIQGKILELNANPNYSFHKIYKDNYSVIRNIFKNLINFFNSL